MNGMMRFLCLTVFYLGFAQGAFAHALQPGFLDISNFASESYRSVWRVPDVAGKPMAISARLPENCTSPDSSEPRFDGQAWIVTWISECPEGLAGGEVSIIGLERQATDVLVRYPGPDGSIRSERLTPERVSFVIPADPSAFDVLRTYLPLGFTHILEGWDHLLFVFALLLLIPDVWRLVGAITAFTVAHSFTLAAATLGWVALPSAPVETVIALSIIFLASELAKSDGKNERLSERYPWTVSFAFGLLHGFGFAGALREIGIPETDVPLALVSFNLGVEAGQLFFVAVILTAGAVLRKLLPDRASVVLHGTATSTVVTYAIGGVASYWFFERLVGFWT